MECQRCGAWNLIATLLAYTHPIKIYCRECESLIHSNVGREKSRSAGFTDSKHFRGVGTLE